MENRKSLTKETKENNPQRESEWQTRHTDFGRAMCDSTTHIPSPVPRSNKKRKATTTETGRTTRARKDRVAGDFLPTATVHHPSRLFCHSPTVPHQLSTKSKGCKRPRNVQGKLMNEVSKCLHSLHLQGFGRAFSTRILWPKKSFPSRLRTHSSACLSSSNVTNAKPANKERMREKKEGRGEKHRQADSDSTKE